MSSFYDLQVADIKREAGDAVAVEFFLPENLRQTFAFQPGQYLTLQTVIDGEEIRRCYSICSGTGEAALRIGIRKVGGGAFSTHANDGLTPGDRLQVMAPEGRFTPGRRRNGAHYLAIAAGSGITPILSIMKSILPQEPDSQFTLIYGNRTSQSVMFAEDIEDLKNRYLGRLSLFHVLSREPQDVEALAGRIDPQRLQSLSAGLIDFTTIDEAFICGPEAMITQSRQALIALGMDAQNIRSELFTPAAPRKTHHRADSTNASATAKTIARIGVTLDGKVSEFDLLENDESIIEAARRAGLELPYSCRGGMCCTCRCKVEAGRATMAVNYSLEPWELERGFILACQAQPATPELALDFDQM